MNHIIDLSSELTIKYGTLIVTTIGVIAAIIGSYITVRKYFYEKNREIYIRRLDEVYAPLYGLVIKQKKYLELYHPDEKLENDKLLTLVAAIARKQATEQRKRGIGNVPEEDLLRIENMEYGLDANDFLEILKNANKGLMRPKLLTIYYQLEIANYLSQPKPIPEIYRDTEQEEKSRKQDKKTNEMKIQLERELINEIEGGYVETIKKLDID